MLGQPAHRNVVLDVNSFICQSLGFQLQVMNTCEYSGTLPVYLNIFAGLLSNLVQNILYALHIVSTEKKYHSINKEAHNISSFQKIPIGVLQVGRGDSGASAEVIILTVPVLDPCVYLFFGGLIRIRSIIKYSNQGDSSRSVRIQNGYKREQ
jgi:hypothetical protein